MKENERLDALEKIKEEERRIFEIKERTYFTL